MTFKDVISKIRHAILCCSKNEQTHSLDIGSPTDVRRVDVSDALPGLTDAQRKFIREKASSDAIHLLGLQSHPPSHPPSELASSPPSPEHSLRCEPSSIMSSREPSLALLNAASKDLPSSIPTPPRQTHAPASPPSVRLKSMWDGTKRFSGTSSCRDSLYSKLEESGSIQSVDKNNKNKPTNDSCKKLEDSSFITLNLEFGSDSPNNKKDLESARTLSLASGFETQDTVGGHNDSGAPLVRNEKVRTAIKSTEMEDSSESDEDPFVEAEGKPLVKT